VVPRTSLDILEKKEILSLWRSTIPLPYSYYTNNAYAIPAHDNKKKRDLEDEKGELHEEKRRKVQIKIIIPFCKEEY
jgi:hypothetical protein